MGEADELPVHQVYADAFWMDTYQVSVGHYARFLEATGQDAPPDWPIMNRSPHQKRPVVNVEWADAKAYCTWARKRLPTEAEREKAARGTDGRTYPWGNEHPTKLFANVNREQWNNHHALTPVGTFEEGKSPYGIYDMAGNVWQAAEKLDLCTKCRWNLPNDVDVKIVSGCSKRPSSKAAVSEEARRYVPHFVWAVRP